MEALWKKCLAEIEKQVPPENFKTWFLPTYPFSTDGQFMSIAVPDEFFKRYLTENYLALIENSLESISNSRMQVSFLVNPATLEIKEPEKPISSSVKQTGNITLKSSLSPKYSFSNFVVGPSNEFAHAASQAVSANPAIAYNPLFIYGPVGLGKTHLLHSIGNAILQKDNSAKIKYVSSEGFTIELIQSIKRDKTAQFREKYRYLDVLIIDDIQFLSGKERTQEEFFYTFNTLFEAHKQIILSSDAFPKDIQKIEERLRSRFECGLIADLKPPDFETKVAILLKKSETHNLEIPQDVAIFIAENIKSNIRELEGLLIRLIAYSSFTRKKINVQLAKEVLKEFTYDQNQNFSIPNILKHTCEFFEVKLSDLKSKRRPRNISIPRQIAMYLCREYTKVSLPEIGRQLGGKDHTTVIFSYKKIKSCIKENNEISNSVQEIIQRIRSE